MQLWFRKQLRGRACQITLALVKKKTHIYHEVSWVPPFSIKGIMSSIRRFWVMCGGFWFLLQSLQLQEPYSKMPNTGGTACSPQTKDRNSSLTPVTPGGRLPPERWKAFPGTSTDPTENFSWLYEEQFLNAEGWSLFHTAAVWTSSPAEESAASCVWWETLLQPSIHYGESWWQESSLMGLVEAAPRLPKVQYLQLSSCKEPPWWRSVMAAAPESHWFERERAAGVLLSLRRAIGWKMLRDLFPCLPRSPVARFPSGLLETAVRIYTLKTRM